MTELIEKEYYGVNSPVLAMSDMIGNSTFSLPKSGNVDTDILNMVCGTEKEFCPELLTKDVQTWFLSIDQYLDVPILGLFGREGVQMDIVEWREKFVKCSGHLKFLQSYTHDMSKYNKYGTNIACWASENGHLGFLKWIRDNGGEWSDDAADSAARNGHLETLKWIRDNGGTWSVNAAKWAAENGKLETLKWIRDNGG